MAGATTTTARQLVRVAGAVAGAGLAVSLWPPDEEDGGGGGRDLGNRSNVNNNNNNNLAKRPQYPRVHLLKHLDVRLVQQQQQPQQQQSQVTTAFFRPPPSSWLVPTTSTQQHVPSSSLQAHEQQQDEDGAKDMEQQQQKQQHPLIFISCADPFVMENLVQDVLELRLSQGQEVLPRHIVVDFIARNDDQQDQQQQVLVNANPPQSLSSALADLDNASGGLDHSMVVLHLDPLLSSSTAMSATITKKEVLQQVVEWLQGHQQSEIQIVLTASTPLALWRLQNFVLLKEHKHKEQQDQQGHHQQQQTTTSLPIFHLAVLGPNQALREQVLSSLRPATLPVVEKEEKKNEEEEEDGRGEEGGKDEVSLNADKEEDEQDSHTINVPSSSSSATLQQQEEFWSLRPSLNSTAAAAASDDSLSTLIVSERDKLREALEETNNDAAVLLWNILHAIHGERIDLLSQTQMTAAQEGVVPLALLLELCDHDFRKLENLMAQGWLEPFHPEVFEAEGEVEMSQSQEAKEDDDHREGEQQDTTLTTTKESTKPLLVCRGSMETLGGNELVAGTHQEEAFLALTQTSLPTMLTTPAPVTLAWKALKLDQNFALKMNARADARHFAQQAAVLQQHRQALNAEWGQLYQGRLALRERKDELTTEDFIGLQLELMRLERSAASRALEMSLRHKRLRELHMQLKDVLEEDSKDLPSLGLLAPVPSAAAAANNNNQQEPMMAVPVEEIVLAEMNRGLRGVPVEDLSSSSSPSSPSSQKRQQQTREGQASRRRWWWPFGKKE